MIITNANIISVTVFKSKNDSPLIVYADKKESDQIPSQRLKPI